MVPAAGGTQPGPVGAVILHFNITLEMLTEERQTASRIAAERKLSVFERAMKKSSHAELTTLGDMSKDPSSDRSDLDPELRLAYRTMVETSVSPTGARVDQTVREMARAIAQKLSERGADASDVARLHADALQQVMRTATREKAVWAAHESRMAFIGVLGHLANIYRTAPRA